MKDTVHLFILPYNLMMTIKPAQAHFVVPDTYYPPGTDISKQLQEKSASLAGITSFGVPEFVDKLDSSEDIDQFQREAKEKGLLHYINQQIGRETTEIDAKNALIAFDSNCFDKHSDLFSCANGAGSALRTMQGLSTRWKIPVSPFLIGDIVGTEKKATGDSLKAVLDEKDQDYIEIAPLLRQYAQVVGNNEAAQLKKQSIQKKLMKYITMYTSGTRQYELAEQDSNFRLLQHYAHIQACVSAFLNEKNIIVHIVYNSKTNITAQFMKRYPQFIPRNTIVHFVWCDLSNGIQAPKRIDTETVQGAGFVNGRFPDTVLALDQLISKRLCVEDSRSHLDGDLFSTAPLIQRLIIGEDGHTGDVALQIALFNRHILDSKKPIGSGRKIPSPSLDSKESAKQSSSKWWWPSLFDHSQPASTLSLAERVEDLKAITYFRIDPDGGYMSDPPMFSDDIKTLVTQVKSLVGQEATVNAVNCFANYQSVNMLDSKAPDPQPERPYTMLYLREKSDSLKDTYYIAYVRGYQLLLAKDTAVSKEFFKIPVSAGKSSTNADLIKEILATWPQCILQRINITPKPKFANEFSALVPSTGTTSTTSSSSSTTTTSTSSQSSMVKATMS